MATTHNPEPKHNTEPKRDEPRRENQREFEVVTENHLGQRVVHRVLASSPEDARKRLDLPERHEAPHVVEALPPGEGAGRL